MPRLPGNESDSRKCYCSRGSGTHVSVQWHLRKRASDDEFQTRPLTRPASGNHRNLPGNELHQLGVVGDDVVFDTVAELLVQSREELAGAVDLGSFDAPQFEGRE